MFECITFNWCKNCRINNWEDEVAARQELRSRILFHERADAQDAISRLSVAHDMAENVYNAWREHAVSTVADVILDALGVHDKGVHDRVCGYLFELMDEDVCAREWLEAH